MGIQVAAVPMFDGKVTAADVYVNIRDLFTTKREGTYQLFYKVEYAKDDVKLMNVNKVVDSVSPVLDVWATAYNHLKLALTADGLTYTDVV